MPEKKYIVDLTDDERHHLQQLLRSGKHATRKLTRARILLQAAAGFSDKQIAVALGVGRSTVERTRRRFVVGSLDALNERPRPGKKPKLDARTEARLLAEACTPAPKGRKHWTMQLLADRLVALQLVETISDETVRRTLKKRSSSRGLRSSGVFPP